MSIELKPHNLNRRSVSGAIKQAWWYECRNHIEIFVSMRDGGGLGTLKITRKQLEAWIRRAERRGR